jgi:hypothetical protein
MFGGYRHSAFLYIRTSDVAGLDPHAPFRNLQPLMEKE